VDCWSSQRSSQADTEGDSPQHAPSAAAANRASSSANVPSSSQGSSSIDDDDDEPLYVRLQRLHQARQAIESRKRRGETSDDSSGSAKKKPAIKATEVIEIE
jgi:hypothetical protein